LIVHAGAVAKWINRSGWRAALIFGPSGAGKSDLALRALQSGWRLVSDDYSMVWSSEGELWTRAPDTIADRIEARGLGIEMEPALTVSRAVLAVVCDGAEIERLPSPESMELQGVSLPCIHLNPLEASALTKVDRALSTRRASPA